MAKKTVVILAAGRGTRLAPLTDDLPKGLIPVAGKPILSYPLEALASHANSGECNVSVVVGHMGDKIAAYTAANFPFVRIVWNHEFIRTNNMVSLALGMSTAAPDHSIVFLNGDCIYHNEIIAAAANACASTVFCDETMAYNPESMKITRAFGTVTGISKSIPKEDAYAVSCDLYALSARDAHSLRYIVHEYISKGDLNQWSEIALNTAMQRRAIMFSPTDVAGKYWYEIDNGGDLIAATDRVNAGYS